jgi:hypothetical protein
MKLVKKRGKKINFKTKSYNLKRINRIHIGPMWNKKFNNFIIANLTSDMERSSKPKWIIGEREEIHFKDMKNPRKRREMLKRDEIE